MHETRKTTDHQQCCFVCERIDVELHGEDDEDFGRRPPEYPVPLCPDHRYEAHRLLEKGHLGVSLENAHLVYLERHRARRGGRLKRFGEIGPVVALPQAPRVPQAPLRARSNLRSL
jgi:hypothetical protein